MKCNQKDCNELPIYKIYWPGQSPPLLMCKFHTEQALGVGRAIGLVIHIEEIE